MADISEVIVMSEKTLVMSEESDYVKVSDSHPHRQQWSGRFEFLLSMIGYSIGAGNLWRYSYLCHKNGGGAFVIPYLMFLLLCGIPLSFMEISVGQFSGAGALGMWRICPFFKGIGYTMAIISLLYSLQSSALLSWILYYLSQSFKAELPWLTCNNSWNTEYCLAHASRMCSELFNDTDDGKTRTTSAVKIPDTTKSCNHRNSLVNQSLLSSPEEEFWQYNLLHMTPGIEDLGGIQGHLAVSSLVGWIMITLCLIKGTKSIGKVVYVTAGFPYILLTVFLVRSLMLPGSKDGIVYYLTPNFEKLLSIQVWIEACIQVFFSLGMAWGGVITMASFNKFHNNCFRDSIIFALVDGFTSIYGGFITFAFLGYIAHETGQDISQTLKTGPGVVLVIYSGAVGSLPLPQVWSVLLYLMLLLMAIDSSFGTFKTVIECLQERFPRNLGKHRTMTLLGLCCFSFIVSLAFTFQGGIYLFQIFDWYSSSVCLIVVSFLESVVIGWIYGAQNFSSDIEMMLGKLPGKLMRLCWCFFIPFLMLIMFLFIMITYQPPTYGRYNYPYAAEIFGLFLAFSTVVPIPVVSVFHLYRARGKVGQRLKQSLKPTPDWGPAPMNYWYLYQKKERQNSYKSLFQCIKTNICGEKDGMEP